MDTSFLEIKNAIPKCMGFVQDRSIFLKKDGPEANLIRCVDGKIRLLQAQITDEKNVTKHAFVHQAFPMQGDHPNHVGVIIDNRENEPICLIETEDGEDKMVARQVLQNFFGGSHVSVRILTAYIFFHVPE